MSAYFTIHPWQYADLTFGEIERYVKQLELIRERLREAGRG